MAVSKEAANFLNKSPQEGATKLAPRLTRASEALAMTYRDLDYLNPQNPTPADFHGQ